MTLPGQASGACADDSKHTSAIFLRWTFLRAVFHRGYVLTSGLYYVVTAHLPAAQLLLLATVMSAALLLTDIPAGAWSDAIGRQRPLVIGHGFLAAGMMLTGLVTAFPLLLVSQVLWALGWAFSGGADVAWLTDELAAPGRIARVLAARARWDLIGGAAGIVAFGALGWAAGLASAIVVSGAATAVLGGYVALRFAEDNFTVVPGSRWRAALSILRGGLNLARRDHEILLMLTATLLINGAYDVAWLFPRRLVGLGLAGDTVPWYTALGILSFAIGAVALRAVEARIDAAGAARRIYALSCLVGVAGLTALAIAPDVLVGSIGVVLVAGIANNVTRAVSVIWVNRRTASSVRATVHSVLSQVESAGEISAGFVFAGLASAAGTPATLLASAAVMAMTGGLVAWWRGRARAVRPG
jgi:MFS family permease